MRKREEEKNSFININVGVVRWRLRISLKISICFTFKFFGHVCIVIRQKFKDKRIRYLSYCQGMIIYWLFQKHHEVALVHCLAHNSHHFLILDCHFPCVLLHYSLSNHSLHSWYCGEKFKPHFELFLMEFLLS